MTFEARIRRPRPSAIVTALFAAVLEVAVGFPRPAAADEPYPVPLDPKLPLGSLIYDPTAAGAIGAPGEIRTFHIDIDPGQTLTAVVVPEATLQPLLEVEAASVGPLGSAAAALPGEAVLLQTLPTHGSLGNPGPDAVTCLVSVSGLGGSVGGFELRLVLNAAVEEESYTSLDDDSLETAQDLEPSFLPLLRAVDASTSGPHPDRGAVVGHSEGTNVPVVSEDFESGTLGPDFTTFSSDPNGRIQVSDASGAAGGSFALLMDTSVAGPNNLNEAIWTVDLSGVPDALLRFFHADFNDEETALPADFTGSVDGDGVSISDDGLHWHTVLNATNVPSGWQEVVVDLAAAAAAAGMSLGPDFQIKFQQFDNFPINTDGRGYDEITILTAGAGDLYRFDLEAGETATLAVTGQSDDALRLALLDAAGDPVVLGSAAPQISNGSFESGDFTGWTPGTTGTPFRPWAVTGAGQGGGFGMATTLPQDGSFAAWNGFDGTGPMEFTLFQDVDVPGSGASPLLEWQDRVQWNFTLGGTASLPRLYDVEIRDPGTDAVLETLFSLSTGTQAMNPTGDTGWQMHSADLSAYAGSRVRVLFRAQIPESGTGPGQLEIDGVRLGTAVPSNVADLVRSFRSDDPATYFARVGGMSEADYSLLVLRNADFDLEANDGIESAQELLAPQTGGRKWVLGHAGHFTPGVLYGASRVGELFTLDLATGAGSPVGMLPTAGSTEIEIDNADGSAFTQFPDGSFAGQAFHLETAAAAGPVIPTGLAFNGLEYVGGMLYGTGIPGSRGPSRLRILDPASGLSLDIGPTGVGPIAGLAYDEAAAVLYGIAGGPGPADLYTLDLGTGAATPVGSSGIQAGSLEFGPDGQLYAGGTGADGGILFRVDPATAATTPVGPTGFATVTGLALRQLSSAPDSDFYRVTLAGNGNLRAETRTPADAAGEFGNQLDPVLRLYDAAGNLLASDDDSGPDGSNARLSYHAPRGAGGTYFLEVAAAGETEGEYILSLQGIEPRGRARTHTAPSPELSSAQRAETAASARTAPLASVSYGVGSRACGLGFELAFLLPPLLWLRQRRRAVQAPPRR